MNNQMNSDLNKRLNVLERKEAAKIGNRAVEKCFDKCVESLRSKKLNEMETNCIENCTSLYLDTINRVYTRFEEIQKKEMPK